jgi:hypothetical protein
VGRIEAVDLQTRATHTLVEGTNPQFSATGDLLFERQEGIWAAAFDAKGLAIVGTPVPVLESVRLQGPSVLFATARDGSIAYVTGAAPNTSLVWIDRAGQVTPAVDARGAFQSPRLSPDGKRGVVSVADGSSLDLWALGAMYNFDQNFADYDVAPDGRFLAIRRDAAAPDEIQVVLNWTQELRRVLKR